MCVAVLKSDCIISVARGPSCPGYVTDKWKNVIIGRNHGSDSHRKEGYIKIFRANIEGLKVMEAFTANG